jgi:hypothetical protein
MDENRRNIRDFVGQTLRRKFLGRPRVILMDGIKTNLQKWYRKE